MGQLSSIMRTKLLLVMAGVILFIILLILFVIPFSYSAVEHREMAINHQLSNITELSSDVLVVKYTSLFNIITGNFQMYYVINASS